MSKFIPIAGAMGVAAGVLGYMTRSNVKNDFAKMSFYKDGIRLLDGYKPLADKIGQPMKFDGVDISDDFNYKDLEKATAKVPVTGKNRKAELLIYAKRDDGDWWVEKLEVVFKGSGVKYKFYELKQTPGSETTNKTNNEQK